jgi:hypothetical protein
MTSAEFSNLDEHAQTMTLIDKGVYLSERQYKNFSILLYQVDNFYVEIYHNLCYNVLQGFSSFEDEAALEPYLQKIDISQLCEN